MADSARTLRVGLKRCVATARPVRCCSADAPPYAVRSARAFGDDVLRTHGFSMRVSTADVSVALVQAAHPSVLGLLRLSLLDTEVRAAVASRLLASVRLTHAL